MKYEITFSKPQNVGPNDLDGVELRFPFTLRKVHDGAEKDEISQHSVTVRISGTLQTMWSLGERLRPLENQDLVRTLFEHARREVESKAKSGDIPSKLSVGLATDRSPKINPFDTRKIANPEGYHSTFEIAKPIGF